MRIIQGHLFYQLLTIYISRLLARELFIYPREWSGINIDEITSLRMGCGCAVSMAILPVPYLFAVC